MTERPTAYELWRLAGGETKAGCDVEHYREPMLEHGHLVPLKPGEKAEPLPCGWPTGRDDTWDPEEAADE